MVNVRPPSVLPLVGLIEVISEMLKRMLVSIDG